jgi:hypothetical protein
MEQPNITLADTIMERCATNSFIAAQTFGHKHAHHAAREVTALMRQAQKYVIEDDATAAALSLAMEHPDVLVGMLSKARTKFRVVFIEWNNQVRMESTGQAFDPTAPTRVGAMIERLHETKPHYRMTFYDSLCGTKTERGWLMPALMSIEYNLHEPIPPSEATNLIEDKAEIAHNVMQVSALGSSYQRAHIVDDEEGNTFMGKMLFELTSHLTHIFNPIMPMTKSILMDDGGPQNKLMIRNGLRVEVIENAGSWRLAVAFLALMNDNTYLTAKDAVLPAKRRTVGSKVVPYLRHQTLSLALPRKIVERKARKDFVQEAARLRPRRLQGGYFAQHRKRGDPKCEHVYVRETDTRERCMLCQHAIWWVSDHMRGSLDVGILTHDHVVKT